MKLGEGSSLIVVAAVNFDNFVVDEVGVGACEEGDGYYNIGFTECGIMGLW